MSLINREELLKSIMDDGGLQYPRWWYLEKVREMPEAQPEQKSGKWINGYCSECGEHAPFWSMASTYYESNYCPNCGAKMEEQDG